MASREGFNLGTRLGWGALWRALRFRSRYIPWRYVWRDTLGRYICWSVGHTKKTFHTEDRHGLPVDICYRCFQEVE
ncbi:hypothetical protein LCGC14_2878760 [marine sediment metagenome]|uniref:Uncharacterized protein n=1 Tax=marine sediment metagenome TaxID=412755 RepID=A0A0F9A8V9_9ZZZZ